MHLNKMALCVSNLQGGYLMLFPHKPKSCELLEIPGREDFGWNDNLFFFLASRARHLQFAKQIQDKVPSWAGWYSRAHRLLCHSIDLSSLLPSCFPWLRERTAQLFPGAICLQLCSLIKPFLYRSA